MKWNGLVRKCLRDSWKLCWSSSKRHVHPLRRGTRFETSFWLCGLHLTAGKEHWASDSLHNCQSSVRRRNAAKQLSDSACYRTTLWMCLHQSCSRHRSDQTSVKHTQLPCCSCWVTCFKICQIRLRPVKHTDGSTVLYNILILTLNNFFYMRLMDWDESAEWQPDSAAALSWTSYLFWFSDVQLCSL